MNAQTGLIIHYKLNGLEAKRKTDFCRKFWGFRDRSTYGRYTYQRDGHMSNILHIRISSSLFIIRKEEIEDVKKFCNIYDIDLFVREIILVQTDKEQLGLVDADNVRK